MPSPTLFIPAPTCDEMIAEALQRTADSVTGRRAGRRDDVTEKWTEAVVRTSARVFPFPETGRPVAVYCILQRESKEGEGEVGNVVQWGAMDGQCFHARADLSMGTVRRALTDIENLGSVAGRDGEVGSSCPLAAFCVECPGHGFLFSLLTGDNLVPNAVFTGGKMKVEGLKGVHGMQRPYGCRFVAGEGLYVEAVGLAPRYACETR